MKYFAMSLMVVLAMASVATAGVVVAVLDGTATGRGGVQIDRYLLKTDMEGIGAMVGVTVSGNVWQVNNIYPGPYFVRTAWSDENANPPADMTHDTHFTFAKAGMSPLLGDATVVETNTGVPDGSFLAEGLGTFTAGSGFTAGFPVKPLGTTFMQVVIPHDGGSATITGKLATLQHEYVFEVTVPEPSSIIMLVAGAVCLLGIRRK